MKLEHKKIVKLSLIAFIVSFILSLGTMVILFIPKIDVSYNEIKISYKDDYISPNYKAYNVLNDFSNKVSIDNNIELHKIGTYYSNYHLKYGISNINKKVKISVVDEDKPIIKLNGNVDTIVCPNKEYIEEGYSAYDEYDGELSDKVVVNNELNKITYTVSDSSLNSVEVIRNLNYIDNEKPKITLNGSSTYYVKLNSKYKEPGYKVIDNCDNDLSNSVVVSGSINTKKTGKYTLTYTVTDNAGNSNSLSRDIWVYKNTVIPTGSGEKGVIYLTFDDGPSAYTKTILDILKDEGVKATFFVTTSGSDSIIKREYNEGHTVALHTSSHNYSKIYSSVNNYFKDLDTVQNRVKKLTGEESKIIRFPGGSSNTVSRNYDKGIKIMSVLTSEVLNRGYKYYDWNVDSGDAGGCAASGVSNRKNCVYKNVTKYLSKNKANVVLMHDIKSYTKDALRDIIAYGKVNGYTFKAITYDTAMVVQRVNN